MYAAADRVSIIASPLRNDGSFGTCLQRGTRRHVLVLASTSTADAHKVVLGAVVPDSLRLAGAPLLVEAMPGTSTDATKGFGAQVPSPSQATTCS